MSDALTDQPRLLSKMIPAVTAQVNDGAVTSATTDSNGWDRLNCNGYAGNPAYKSYLGYWSYIDLAGYKQSDLTFVVTGVNIANSAPPTGTGEGFVILDLLTTVPYVTLRTGTEYTIEDNNIWYVGQDTPSPGMPDSILDMEQILLCQKTTYYHDTGWSTTNLQQISGVNTYGQCAALAGDRIYCTRIIMGLPTTANIPDLQIPHCVYHVTGMAVEEDDKSYIMRLRRDYELAKAVDL